MLLMVSMDMVLIQEAIKCDGLSICFSYIDSL